MSNAAARQVPDEADLLCEGCGYTLNGLPDGGNCPECGLPTRESAGERRIAPLWERPQDAGLLRRFMVTTAAVIFHPTRFYRSFATRGRRTRTLWFARIHWAIASLLLGLVAWLHLTWFLGVGAAIPAAERLPLWTFLGFALVIYVFLALTTRLAGRLTNFEASYRGLRLPTSVVLRGLDYHAAHLLPVASLTAATVFGYQAVLWNYNRLAAWGMSYLITLCIEVVVAAAYLFITYWIAMRNMMYANR